MKHEILLEAFGHAVSGSAGTAISTATLYPLDLVTTRLKAQRSNDKGVPKYDGLRSAVGTIIHDEGGVAALYSGFELDALKAVVDSFLFFGIYRYARKITGPSHTVLSELAIGAAAGSLAKLCTTPISNVVTRKQMNSDSDSLAQMLKKMVEQDGARSLWAGYSATLVLTLNPSITFLINGRLARRILPALEEEDVPIAWVAFFLAACSKAIASALTFPFQIGKTRLQIANISPPPPPQDQHLEGGAAPNQDAVDRARFIKRIRVVLHQTIWGTIFQILKREGIIALYRGLQGELMKSFFSHGVTMLTKGLIHRSLLRCRYAVQPNNVGWNMQRVD